MELKDPTNRAKPHSIAKLPALTVTVGLLALAGCGSSSGGSSSSASAPESATPSTPAAASTPASTPTSSSTPSSAPAASAGETLKLEANPEGQLKYNTSSLTAKAGKVAIYFTNMSSIGHNVTVTSSSGSEVGATPTFQGESKTLTLNLKPGTYKFFCSVPGHRMAGMEGTLTVK